jgi:MscS family membrane protein
MKQLLTWLPNSMIEGAFLGVALWQCIGLFLAIFMGMIISTVMASIVTIIIQKTVLKSALKSDPLLKEKIHIKRPLNITFMGWACLLTLSSLGVSETVLTTLLVIAKMMTYLGIVWLGWRSTEVVSIFLKEKAAKTITKFDDLLIPLITRSLKVAVAIIGFVSIAEILKLPLSSIIAGLGIGGIAIAMAAKESISNIFGSLTVLVDRPFSIGDWVKINDVEGTVEALGFRSTKVRTFYDSLISVPNSVLLTAAIDNLGARDYRRISIKLGILYNTPADKVASFCEGVRNLIRGHPDTRKDYFHVYFNDFSESSLDIMVYFFLKVPDWGKELSDRHELFIAFLNLAEEQGISFAFPTRTIHLEKSG